jgi:RNA polymerase sigma-70 factor (ECF subfamily)
VENSESRNIIDVVKRAKSGDSEAFGYLYNEFYTPIYRYIHFRTNSWSEETAEDITQEVFLKAYNSFKNYTYSGKSPLAYFYTIARNILIDKGRKKRVKIERLDLKDELIEEIPDTLENILEQNIRKENEEDLHKKISQLSEDQQDVIILKFIDGLSNAEISKVLNKSEVSVRQLQSKGLKSLRKILNQDE